MSPKKLRNILGLLGFVVAVLGFVFVLGACGGAEHDGFTPHTTRWLLTGMVLIGTGAGAVKTALN